MGWYWREVNKPPPHIHDMPRYDEKGDIHVGDIWECNCGERFTVFNVMHTQDGLGVQWAPASASRLPPPNS